MKNRRQTIVAILFAAVFAFLFFPAAYAADWQEKSLTHDGKTRWYRLLAPLDNMAGKPVVILLHGGGQSMRKLLSQKSGGSRYWRDLALAHDFLLLVPNGVNVKAGDAKGDRQNWNDLRGPASSSYSGADDVGFIRKLLKQVQRQYDTDPARVLVTGSSNGGMMTYRMLMEAPEIFSAGAAFIAALPAEDTYFTPPVKPVPIMIVAATHDKLVRFKGGKVAKNRGVVRSAKDTLAWWIGANKASPAAEKKALADLAPDDGCTVTRRLFSGEHNGADVVSYVLRGGGHNMPSVKYSLPDTPFTRRFIGPQCKDVEGAQIAFDFFKSHWP